MTPANHENASYRRPEASEFFLKQVQESARVIGRACPLRPKLAVVLGSGFHEMLRQGSVVSEIPYQDLPAFPQPRVVGHAGRMCIAEFGKTPVMVLSGRSHYYEGHDLSLVTLPMRVLHARGVESVLLTNAAGGINARFRVGDFMAITDHINLMGANPLRGSEIPGLPQFVDMTSVYDAELRTMLRKSARLAGARVHQGVYLATTGPSYETPAEIRAFAHLGADAVGMSTVPEAIVARQCGLRVAGLSCITNLAAGRSKGPLSHAEVLETAKRAGSLAAQLLKSFVDTYAKA